MLAWLSLPTTDYVVQGLLACLIFIRPWLLGERKGCSVFLLPFVAIWIWGFWRVLHFDPLMKNDIPGAGYLAAALPYSFIAWVLYLIKQWLRRCRAAKAFEPPDDHG